LARRHGCGLASNSAIALKDFDAERRQGCTAAASTARRGPDPQLCKGLV